jgi:hypothetical protein
MGVTEMSPFVLLPDRSGDVTVMGRVDDHVAMEDSRSRAVLVVTTLPEGGAVRARVLSTLSVDGGVEKTVIVESLADLHRVLDTWWARYWDC